MESGPITHPGHYVNLNLLSLGFERKHPKAKNTLYLKTDKNFANSKYSSSTVLEA